MGNLAEDLEPSVPQAEVDAAAAEQPKTEEKPKAEIPKQEEPTIEGEEVKEEKARADKFVKIQALDEQKHKRRAAEAEAQRLREQNAILADRFQQILAAQQPVQQVPAFEENPAANLQHGLQLTQQQLHQLLQRQQMEDQQRQQHNQRQQLVGWARNQAAEYAKENPEFIGAYEHVRGTRMKELEAMGLSEEAMAQTLVNDELWLFNHAAQTGKNPAEIVHSMAKNLGYKAKKAEIPAEEKVDALNKGAAAAKGLGAGAGDGKPTPEQIANMSEDEFAEFKAKLSKKGQRVSDVF